MRDLICGVQLGPRQALTDHIRHAFPAGARPLEVLNPITERQLHSAPDDLTEQTYQNFALTDEAVIFFFGQNQLVPDNSGPHRVAVPSAELVSLLA